MKKNGWLFTPVLLVALVFIGGLFARCSRQPSLQGERRGGDAGVSAMHGAAPLTPSPVRHIILFIGDGMSLADETAASSYLHGAGGRLPWNSFPYRTFVTTWDVDTYNAHARTAGRPGYGRGPLDPSLGYDPSLGGGAPYPAQTAAAADSYFLKTGGIKGLVTGAPQATDSAAAATAMATGAKTDAGNVAWAPGDAAAGRLTSIAERLRAGKGFAVGAVTTVPFSHATPAAFFSHAMDRNQYYRGYRLSHSGIADEIITATKPEVVIGGGWPRQNNPSWSRLEGYISRRLYDTLKTSKEYVLAERQAGASGSETLRRAAAQAADSGLKLFGLFGGEDGGFAPGVAADRPGYPSVVRGDSQDPSLAAGVSAALKLLSKDPEGFFLLAEQGDIDWADHEHDYARMVACVSSLGDAVSAAVRFVETPGDDVDWNNTVLIVTADHANGYLRPGEKGFPGKGDLPRQVKKGGDWTYPDGDVAYRASGHTNELVSLYAVGDNAAGVFRRFEGMLYPGSPVIDNTHVYHAIAAMAGAEPGKPVIRGR